MTKHDMKKLNDPNAHFYMALYWVACLPFGQRHCKQICDEFDMPYMDFQAPQKALDKIELDPFFDANEYKERYPLIEKKIKEGVTYDEAQSFFVKLLEVMQWDGDPKKHKPEKCELGEYISLEKSAATSTSEFHFSDEIEAALLLVSIEKDIELDRQMLGHGLVCLHDDGQTFAHMPNKMGKLGVQTFKYPGHPDVPHKVYARLRCGDILHVPDRLIREVSYRIVPLKAGQKFNTGWNTMDGGTHTYENIATEGQILAVGLDNQNYDPHMSDEDLIDHPLLGYSCEKEDFEVGYVPYGGRYDVVATDQPNIMKQVSKPLPYMDIKEKTQIGWGLSMRMAYPGDKITAEYNDEHSDVFILRQKFFDREGVNIIVLPTKGNSSDPNAPLVKRPSKGPRLN